MTKISKLPERDAPLTAKEIKEAGDIFFPLFNDVSNRMPEGATTEDVLKVMENVAKLAQKERVKAREKKTKVKFGFNKEESTNDDTNES